MSSESASHSLLYCAEDAADLNSPDADADAMWISSPHHHPSYIFYSHSPPSDESTVAELMESEVRHMPEPDYLRRCRDGSVDVTARQDSINWILKVHARHRFSPVTAFLSVNYLDRFLSYHSLPKPNEWPFQLLSVACLSLAAKMEEPRVPLLLDLQMCDPAKYVFEPRTVQRMELWVMSNLGWRLRSVTPFDFLHFFISKLIPSSSSSSLAPIFSASSDLILSTIRVTDFLAFTPSTIAAAAVLCAAGGLYHDCEATTSFHERVNKEMVRSCHQLMEEYLVDTCPANIIYKDWRAEPVAPPSPVAVLDAAACGSCDMLSETVGSTSTTSDRAEAPPKRLRSSASDVQQR